MIFFTRWQRCIENGRRVWSFALLSAAVSSFAAVTNDPLCSLTNILRELRPDPAQPASTRQMVEKLEVLRDAADPRMIPFLNDEYAQILQSSLTRTTNLQQQIPIRYQLGVQLLNAGRSETALKEFEAMESAIVAGGGTIDARSRAQVRIRKILSSLRMGEQENCLANHNNQSCLFPLAPEAVHQLPRGSRGAIALLNVHLQELPNDLSARWLLNLAYMTLGEYPAQVPGQYLIPPKAFASEYDLPRFPDVASELGLAVDDLAGSCIADDFDNDGFVDIVASAWGMRGQLRYFRNDGSGRFIERTREAGLTGLVSGLNIQQTDYNNDGYLDIWVLRGAWMGKPGRIPNSLLRNNGDGTVTDVTVQAGLLSFHPTQASVWFDFDSDGWLDVFIGNESTDRKDPDLCELYRNNRDGTFTECASAVGLRVARFVKGVTSADYDQDGRPDLYLSCRREGANMLFRNDGPVAGASSNAFAWRFSETSRSAGVFDTNLISFPTWFFDYDNDGWEDLFVSGYMIESVGDVAADYLGLPHQGAVPRLYHNNRNGTFSDVTVAKKLNRVCLTMGCNFGDLDNDGWLDFYLGTGNPDFTTLVPNRMFRNAEGKFFQEVTTTTGTGHLQKGHGVSFADLDNDGDQDIYTVIGGAYSGDHYRNSLFLNPGNSNRWLKLKLEGVRSNRASIGARIKVLIATPTGAREIHKTVNGGSSFGANPLRQEFGLGNATAVTGVEITWPATGVVQKISGIEMNHAYRIREGGPECGSNGTSTARV
ncbi:MAG: CRTAC1 family protein [Verrucomicrobia bacterium]|nr:CRTAC1 family protein [Verrucomicrobiota bacterium]